MAEFNLNYFNPIFLIRRKIIDPIFFIKKLNLLYKRHPEVSKLVNYNDLKGLPEPVHCYFRKVLREGMPYISSAKLTLSGCFKHGFDEDWAHFEGEEYITAIKPGIVRNIKTKYTAETSTFISGKGDFYKWNYSSLFTLTRKGQVTSQAQLLLWLGQAVWFPSSLLPNAFLSWSPVSSSCANATFIYRGIKIFFKACFNDKRELCRIESLRCLPNGKPEKWAVKFSNYQLLNAVYVPMQIEAFWIIDDIEHPYFNCTVETIEYDTPGFTIPPDSDVRANCDTSGEVA